MGIPQCSGSQFQQSQTSIVSAKLPPFNAFFCILLKSTGQQRNLKSLNRGLIIITYIHYVLQADMLIILYTPPLL